MILIIDNYDSFTYNLSDYLHQLQQETSIWRNDEITIQTIKKLEPKAIVLSPGPKTPEEAGILLAIIKEFYDKIPLLGICLGHQAIGQFFGGRLKKALHPMHGKTSPLMFIKKDLITEGLPEPVEVMRYHSLIIDDLSKTDLETIAITKEQEVMLIKHKKYLIYGMQFHPESILTNEGLLLLSNWLQVVGLR